MTSSKKFFPKNSDARRIYGYVYKTIDKKTGKRYIGSVHVGKGSHRNIDTLEYYGSNEWIERIREKRPQDLIKVILPGTKNYVDDVKITQKSEQEWLDRIPKDQWKLPGPKRRYMNFKSTAAGGAGPRSEKTRQKIGHALKSLPAKKREEINTKISQGVITSFGRKSPEKIAADIQKRAAARSKTGDRLGWSFLKGKSGAHKRNENAGKEFILIHDSGKQIKGRNLAKYAREYPEFDINALYSGYDCGGWRLKGVPPKQRYQPPSDEEKTERAKRKIQRATKARRERYHTDPEYAATAIARVREYYATHPESAKRRKKYAHEWHLKNKTHTDDRRAKLSENDIVTIRERGATGESIRSIARAYGVSRGTIQDVLYRRTWSNVKGGPAYKPRRPGPKPKLLTRLKKRPKK